MLEKLKINVVLSVGIVAVLTLVIGVLIPVVLGYFSSIVGQAERSELKALFNNAKAEIESESKLAEAMSRIVAMTPEVQQALAQGDRKSLADRTVPLFKLLKKEYGARQFQFHYPPATSFLRAHKPEKFGDDLSSFRLTVVETNTKKTTVRGLEKGVAGLGIRGISPVTYNGKHVGSVEFGMSFGQAFFDQFKGKYNADIALFVPADNGFKTFGSTYESKESLFDATQLQRAIAGEHLVAQTTLGDVPVAVYAETIVDFSGKPVGVLEISMNRERYIKEIANSRNSILLIGAGALALGLLIAMWLARSISRPLCDAAEAMNEIAQGNGDLTKRLPENGKNEITALATAFNRFAEKVRNMIVQVSGSTNRLADSVEEVSAITSKTNGAVQNQRSETEQVATAMNEMTATMQEVARNATDAADAASKADEEARSGQGVVRQTITSIEQLASEVIHAADVIETLKSRSDEIGSVLDVIKGIAEQTNLLALNAAIEAARAGEQGRGFAVVADEVRTLASRTQESTEEIQTMIEHLQAGSADAADVMENSRRKADESVREAAAAGSSLDIITRAVEVIKDMNTQIASAAEEQNSVASEINRNIVNINDAVSATAEGANQTSVASSELARLSDELRLMVGQFRT